MLRRVEAATRCDQDEMLALFEQSRINLNLVSASQGAESQIKGRTFEVPACGGFLLDGPAEGLAEYFDIGRELVVYEDVDDLTEKCRFYLSHDDARTRIANAGHYRVHREHTYVERFRHIFAAMGLS
jgi:spore maturation protein CgeB